MMITRDIRPEVQSWYSLYPGSARLGRSAVNPIPSPRLKWL